MNTPFEQATTFFTGNALKIYCSARIVFIQTKEGYKVSCRSNDWGECATNKQLGQVQVEATYLNRHVGIQELSVGGYHCYAKLKDKSFIGWGCNTEARLGEHIKSTTVYIPVLLGHHKRGITKLVCGYECTFGITDIGQLYFWGTAKGVCSFNCNWQIINMPQVIMPRQRFSNVFVDQLDKIVSGVANDGKVYVWGREIQTDPVEGTNAVALKDLYGLAVQSIFINLESCAVILKHTAPYEIKKHKFADVDFI